MQRLLRIRLQAMMFLQYFINGAIIPIFSLYLKQSLHFSGEEVGAVMAMSAASAFVAPVLGSLVADRLMRIERLYSLCLLGGGVLMLLLSYQTGFLAVMLIYLAYMLVYGSTSAMSTVIALHHEPDAKRGFGSIRMWGTVGFIAAAWLFGYLWLSAGGGSLVAERLPDALKLSAIVTLLLGLYALTLPRSPALLPAGSAAIPDIGTSMARIPGTAGTGASTLTPSSARRLLPIDSLKVFLDPHVLLFLVMSFFVWTADSFYYFGASLFLSWKGVATQSIMPLLSIGQMVEVATMGLLGFLLTRYGFRRVFIAGAAMEFVRFTILAIGAPFGLVVAGLAVHGFCYGLFFGSAMIFLDAYSTASTRAGVQQLFTIVTGGFGALVGNLSAGKVLDAAAASGAGYRLFWTVPALLTLGVAVVLLIFFRERQGSAVSADRLNGLSDRTR
ncbi:MAG TPA: MFS transporter [Spirochaetia bacterium]|nr:MFS transporter [Spirochaetia bacterium]